MGAAINRDEWLKALTDAGCHSDEDDQQALTIREFATMFGMGRMAAEIRLKRLVDAGKATETKKWAATPDGRRRHLKAYRLIEPTKKARRAS